MSQTRSWMAVPALAVGVLLLAGAPAFAADTATIYDVSQEGLSSAEAQKLADTYGIPSSVAPNGAFTFTGKGFGEVPQKQVGRAEKDESGRPVISQALDIPALQAIRSLDDKSALKRAAELPALAGLGGDFKAEPSISHAELTTANADGKTTGKYALDTSVSYNLTLGGLPATGQGAKLRITLAGDGSVTQLSSSIRRLTPGQQAIIISSDEATKACAALYAKDVRQAAPTLGYQLPELGAVKQIFPTYTCNPVGGDGPQASRLLPAVQGASPSATFKASLRDGFVQAAADVSGGTAPYTYKWASSTTVLEKNTDASLSYIRSPRDGKLTGEGLTLEVTDANGLTATATGIFEGDGTISAVSTAGGGGYGKLAIGPNDVGIEQTVDEWQCAQDSAIGFKGVMSLYGVGTAFDWRGMNAWEEDFKKTSAGGNDSNYADNVDAMWYTGHGNSSGFTFKNETHDDRWITPSDADWGNGDLEWLQLESCQVLRDTNGANDYFSRWGQTINGLHMLNGFHTNAQCVGGGTGGRFAAYLMAGLTVRNAWAQMAFDKEPGGTVFRSMGNIGAGGVTNINDHFWGKGSTGPDIMKASRTGMWAIAQTV
jgi:hypothetical protein